MKTIAETKAQLTSSFISDEAVQLLYGLDTSKTFDEQFSKVSIESLLFYIVAASIWVLEQLFTLHKQEVDEQLLIRLPHTLRWYRDAALAFRFGYALETDSDTYTDDAIDDAEAAIITYAAVTRGTGELIMKVAKGGDELGKLTTEESNAFKEYIMRIADAGVNVNIVSKDADGLKLVIDVYYNPMILNSEGARLDGGSDTPILSAITDYLQNLPFDGDFTLTDLTDTLQSVEGVENPRVLNAETQWGEYEWEEVVSKYRAEAGWLKIYDIDNDLTINYHANISE